MAAQEKSPSDIHVVQILMCPPDFYGIEYEINPWMSRGRPADHQQAVQQWNDLRDLLTNLGAEIAIIDPVERLPDMVFTANAALIFRQTAVMSRFRPHQRRPEVAHTTKWLAERGFEIVESPAEVSFEGAGDALFCGETLFAGYRIRSDASGHQAIAADLGVQVLPLELVNEAFYHLDTCFCPLAAGEAIWHRQAFDTYAQQVISGAVDQLIEVSQSTAARFGCNAVVVGKHVVTNTGCEDLHDELARRGYEPHATPLDEFVKAGGSAKCLTLRLDGEEAASWKQV